VKSLHEITWVLQSVKSRLQCLFVSEDLVDLFHTCMSYVLCVCAGWSGCWKVD